MNLPTDTLSDEVEPYLLREQYIVRTSRGRVATPRAFQLLGKPMKPPVEAPAKALALTKKSVGKPRSNMSNAEMFARVSK